MLAFVFVAFVGLPSPGAAGVPGSDPEVQAAAAVFMQSQAQKPELKTYRSPGPGHSIQAIGEGGRTITLEDGSVWSVDPRTQFKAAAWEPGALITVVLTKEDPDFNYVLNNEDADDWTFAVLVSQK